MCVCDSVLGVESSVCICTPVCYYACLKCHDIHGEARTNVAVLHLTTQHTHAHTPTYIHTRIPVYISTLCWVRTSELIIHSRQQTDSHWEHTNRGTSLCEETMCVVALTGMACPCFVMNSERRSGTVKKYLKNTLSTSSGVSEISKHCHHKYSSHTANTDHTQAAAT